MTRAELVLFKKIVVVNRKGVYSFICMLVLLSCCKGSFAYSGRNQNEVIF